MQMTAAMVVILSPCSLTDIYGSYYGGFTCVTWSPDGKYVVTGGQDDLVTIWSLAERQIVARCPGHDSWVTAVAFDPWRCDEKTYRFGSIGEDCKLLLWDFNVGMLHRPKGVSSEYLRWTQSRARLTCNNAGDGKNPWEHLCRLGVFVKAANREHECRQPAQIRLEQDPYRAADRTR